MHRQGRSWSPYAATWLWFRNQLRSLSSCRVYAQVSLGRADTADSASTVARPTTKSAKELRVKWQQKEFSAFWADHVGIRVSGLKLSDPGQELVSSDCPATRNHKTPHKTAEAKPVTLSLDLKPSARKPGSLSKKAT